VQLNVYCRLQIILEEYIMSDPFIGEIRLFGFNFNPRGWSFCAGALLPISTNSTLFSLLGTTYGGDGRTTFALPDLRGRAAMSKGRHPGSFFDWRIGQIAGSETHTLTLPELANHSHSATFTSSGGGGTTVELAATTEAGDSETPSAGAYLAAATPPNAASADRPEKIYKASATSGTTVALGGVTVASSGSGGTVTVGTTGNNTNFSIIQPILAMNYCMAMEGLYPARS
jgi:microcystin-dependent protein